MRTNDSAPARIRALRLSKSMTLADLSVRTKLPISTLSKIENDKMSLSYDKLVKIGLGLETDIIRFLADEIPHEPTPLRLTRRSVTASGEGLKIETASQVYSYLASDLLNKSMTPMMMDIKNRVDDGYPELSSHSGEEFVMVITGEILFLSSLYAPIVLYKGDSLYFDASMDHAYVRNSDEQAMVLSVCSASYEELAVARPAALSHG